ncbi:MAG: protein kinase [Polyangiaceae bacterium]
MAISVSDKTPLPLAPVEGDRGERVTVLGKYDLFTVLGRGGMAEVFLAVARGPAGVRRLVVVKRMRADTENDETLVSMFLDEGRLAARLSHPNVVVTYDVGQENGELFIAMEYLEGQSLRAVLRECEARQRILSHAMTARIVEGALAGLHYAHDLKDLDGKPIDIVHRDVSPHNVFVTYDGQVKLVDFGIAKAKTSSSQTESGTVKGKVGYMSPEQAVGSPIDRRSDVFSVGIVLWEMLTGQRLFGGDNMANTLYRLLTEPIPRVSTVIPSVDPRLDAIVARALERDPSDRYPTALAMRDDLTAYLATSGQIVRRDDVAREMNGFFADKRRAEQLTIQAYLAKVAARAGSGDFPAVAFGVTPSGNFDANARTSSMANVAMGTSGPFAFTGTSTSVGTDPRTAVAVPTVIADTPPDSIFDTRQKRWALGAGAAGCALLGLALIVATWKHASAKPAVADGVVAAEVVAPGDALASTGTHAAPTKARSVTAASAPTPKSRALDPAAASDDDDPLAHLGDPEPPPPKAVAEPVVEATPPPVALAPVAEVAPTTPAPKARELPAAPPPPKHAVARTSPKAEAPKIAKAPKATSSATESKGTGFLTVDSYPWSKVTTAGRVLGNTPLVRVPLPPGTYAIRLDNPERGTKTLLVTIAKDEAVTKKVTF